MHKLMADKVRGKSGSGSNSDSESSEDSGCSSSKVETSDDDSEDDDDEKPFDDSKKRPAKEISKTGATKRKKLVWKNNKDLYIALLKVANVHAKLFKNKKHDKVLDKIAKTFSEQKEVKGLKAEPIMGVAAKRQVNSIIQQKKTFFSGENT